MLKDNYWNNKEARAKKAEEYTRQMSTYWKNEIDVCVRETKVYDGRKLKPYIPYIDIAHRATPVEITIEDTDSVSAIIENAKHAEVGQKCAVLNFASFKEPGGMFLKGSSAQEESLCHSSFLFNVLREFPFFYSENRKDLNRALYRDRALYSPDVLFFDANGADYFSDVITCAAPNWSNACTRLVSGQENITALRNRIEFVLAVAATERVDTLILGAYGCGVFGQDPYEVASIFRDFLTDEYAYKYAFEKAIFAIPDGRNGNLDAFLQVFDRELWRE